MVGSAWRAEVEVRYGRRQGLLRHLTARAALHLGRYESLRAVDFSRVRRLVFVCQGNICRSAYAAARAQSLGVESTSFGLGARSGDRADAQALASARRRGLDLTVHRARTIKELPLQGSDLLLAMEPAQAERLATPAFQARAQRTLLGIWGSESRPHLEDPFGLGDAYFDTCFRHIDTAVATVAGRMGGVAR
jgi:protein-tyrosine phosphatase